MSNQRTVNRFRELDCLDDVGRLLN